MVWWCGIRGHVAVVWACVHERQQHLCRCLVERDGVVRVGCVGARDRVPRWQVVTKGFTLASMQLGEDQVEVCSVVLQHHRGCGASRLWWSRHACEVHVC